MKKTQVYIVEPHPCALRWQLTNAAFWWQRNVLAIQTGDAISDNASENVAKRWMIGVETANSTLSVPMQSGIWSVVYRSRQQDILRLKWRTCAIRGWVVCSMRTWNQMWSLWNCSNTLTLLETVAGSQKHIRWKGRTSLYMCSLICEESWDSGDVTMRQRCNGGGMERMEKADSKILRWWSSPRSVWEKFGGASHYDVKSSPSQYGADHPKYQKQWGKLLAYVWSPRQDEYSQPRILLWRNRGWRVIPTLPPG